MNLSVAQITNAQNINTMKSFADGLPKGQREIMLSYLAKIEIEAKTINKAVNGD